MTINDTLLAVFVITVLVLTGTALLAAETRDGETSEVKHWQLKQFDGSASQLVTINRTGQRVDSIEVWPPVGASVTIHRTGKPDVVLLNQPEVERHHNGHGR